MSTHGRVALVSDAGTRPCLTEYMDMETAHVRAILLRIRFVPSRGRSALIAGSVRAIGG